jgi:O-methyltransferase domain
MFWAMAYKISDIVMALTEEGIIERLGRKPATAEVLANERGWHVEALARYLDLLTLAGVLTSNDGQYGIPSATQAVLPLVTMEAQVRRWHAANGSLLNILKTGQGAEPLTRITDPTYLENYQRAMAASARALALHIFRHADLPSAVSIVDIGGADGAVVQQLSLLLPEAHFCVVDRAPVKQHFDLRMANMAAVDRFRFAVGDATSPVSMAVEIKRAGAVLVSNLLHLLRHEQIQQLVVFLRATLGAGARFVVYDQFISSGEFSAADLMTIDWAYLGADFAMTDNTIKVLLEDHGFVDVGHHRSRQLPGALVWATVP